MVITLRYRVFPLSTFFLGSFLLHLLWENLQAPLYAGFTSFQQHFWICLKATATGDMLLMLTIYSALAILHRNPLWVADRAAYAHPATWIIALLLGLLLAVSFELWAVHVAEHWQYAESMPLIPVLQIGFTPVLQMLVIPSCVLFLTHRSTRLL